MEISDRRVVLPDKRGAQRHLRVTWHPTSATVVFSHWDGSVCTASTPVSLGDASEVAGLVVRALGQVAAAPPSEGSVHTPASSPLGRSLWLARAREWPSARWAEVLGSGRRWWAARSDAGSHKRAG